MTQFEHILTLIVSSIRFVIQWVAADGVLLKHIVSGDKVISNYPIVGRNAGLGGALSEDNLLLLQLSIIRAAILHVPPKIRTFAP